MEEINRFLNNKGVEHNFLTLLDSNYNSIDISFFSDYEKCILLRELANKRIITDVPLSIKE